MNIDRALAAAITTAAAAAAAVLAVFAAGFALYALLEPIIGPAGAAGAVAFTAALCLGVFALITQQRARQREREAALARAEMEAHMAEQLPFNFGAIARDRPLVMLALTAVSGLVAARNPALVRDLSALISRFTGR